MAFRALIVLLAVSVLCAGAAAAPRASSPLDIELAIDTTESMGPSIRRMQRDAAKLVAAVERRSAGTHVAVVQFKDVGDTPEYELVQPMTGDAKAVGEAMSRLVLGGGGDSPEAYNAIFRNSYADKAVGWCDGSRKLVVVVGDAEPHGAGKAGLSGCPDASVDPHALKTNRELSGMKANGRTLIMVRQASTASVALHCYESLAAAAYRGGAARDAGSDLTGAIAGLVAAAATLPGPPTAAANPGTTTRAKGPDRTPPHVQAIRSGGDRGTTIRLLYRVTDDSGRSSEKVAVFSGNRVLSQSGWAAFGPADGKTYFFGFPASASMNGIYRFCVQSRDPAGNVSKPSCAPVILS